jgi:hypothetical protein
LPEAFTAFTAFTRIRVTYRPISRKKSVGKDGSSRIKSILAKIRITKIHLLFYSTSHPRTGSHIIRYKSLKNQLDKESRLVNNKFLVIQSIRMDIIP